MKIEPHTITVRELVAGYRNDDEKLEWFKTINIAGKELTDQELLNAVYAGPWTADMKRFFSKSSGPAYTIANGCRRFSRSTARR